MADIDEAALPIKSPGNTDDKTEVQVVDGSTVTQKMTVDSDLNAHVEVHGNDPDGSTDRTLRLSELGAPNPDGDYDASNNTKPASVGAIVHDRAATPDETNQNVRATGVSNGSVHAQDVALHDESGAPFSDSNPFPVVLAEDPGDEILDPDTSSDVASGSSANHDYVVSSGKELRVDRISCSGSGRGKYRILVEDGIGAGTFTEVAAPKFGTEASPNVEFEMHRRLIVSAQITLRIEKNNTDDDDPQNLYSTIIGVEV